MGQAWVGDMCGLVKARQDFAHLGQAWAEISGLTVGLGPQISVSGFLLARPSPKTCPGITRSEPILTTITASDLLIPHMFQKIQKAASLHA
jgi:hypothetical protein